MVNPLCQKFLKCANLLSVERCKSASGLVDIEKSDAAKQKYLLGKIGFDTAENEPSEACYKGYPRSFPRLEFLE